MRIGTQFRITLALFSMVLIAIAVSAIIISMRHNNVSLQENLADDIARGAGELSYYSSEYIIHPDESQLNQWLNRYQSFAQDVDRLSVDTPRQSTLVQEIKKNRDRLMIVFDNIVSIVESSSNAAPTEKLNMLQFSWSRISIQSQLLVSDSGQLAHLLHEEVDQIHTVYFTIVFFGIGAFASLLVSIYFQTFHRALRSLSDLREGAAIVGSGNLDYKLKETKKDEIGEVSKAFNQMASNLKNVMASRSELEREISERKKAEETLQKQASLINLSPDAILIMKPDSTITFWSRGAEILYGWSNEEAVGKKVHDLLETAFPEKLESIWQQLREKKTWSGELVHKTKSGRQLIIKSYWLTRTSNEGNIEEVFESNVDITERAELQKDLQESAIRLEQYANRMEQLAEERLEKLKEAEHLAAIGQTAGMVGHDIRNPLQSIVNELFLMKQDIPAISADDIKSDMSMGIESIENSISYINKIVADLQDYYRKVIPMLKETDLEVMCEEFALKEVPSNVSTSCNIDENAKKVVSDPDVLKRVIGNLVNNAVQAMPQGGSLDIRGYKKEGDVFIVVEDTGVGIPEEAKTKIFTPLFTTKAKGQGFGLAVVKRLVDALGGTVSFESERGKGTKFIVRLPQRKEENENV